MELTPLPVWRLKIQRRRTESGSVLVGLSFYTRDDVLLKEVPPAEFLPGSSREAQRQHINAQCKLFEAEQLPDEDLPDEIVLEFGFPPVSPIVYT